MSIIKQCNACSNYKRDNTCIRFNPTSSDTCIYYLPPFDNSQGMFKRLFSFKGRIRRLEWFDIFVSFGYCYDYL